MFQQARRNETRALEEELVAGRLGRRDFIRRAAALGLSASAIAGALAACGAEAPTATAPAPAAAPAATTAAGGTTAAAAPTAPAAAAASSPTAAPAGGGAAAKRGGGGTLKILEWQAMTILNPHLSSGTKDDLVCDFFYEPLIRVDSEGKYLPTLAEGVPSRENRQLAADGKSATWKLKSDLKWSDGRPVTADDVVFTWEYVSDKGTAATTVALWEAVETAEKVDDRTVTFRFKAPNPAWYRPAQGQILPKHIFAADKGAAARNSPNNLKPVGTGPYKLDDFKPGDMLVASINEQYREPNKPFFDRIEVKGGGDATSAARAVLQTGDYDYAWNLQIEDTVLRQLEGGGKGVPNFGVGGGIERIFINFTDPNKEVDGEQSSLKTEHPFFTDPRVRQAFALASDRESIVKLLYGRAGQVAVNILEDPPQYNSPNNKAEYSLERANALLDEAGWAKRGQYRAKGDVPMAVLYQTTNNSVRQRTQQIIKDGWEKVGVKTELKSIDSGVFFSSDAGNNDTSGKMYCDVQMYTTGAGIDPQSHMERWTSASARWSRAGGQVDGREQWPLPEPGVRPAVGAGRTELDPEKRAQLFIRMNDILIQDVVMIPLVSRKSTYAHAKDLQNMNYSQWEDDYYNIANWTKG